MNKQTHQEWLDGENMPDSTIDKIKNIISRNTRVNKYAKTQRIEICDDELFELNSLINKLIR